jgi:acyl-CoA thioester hydrolase
MDALKARRRSDYSFSLDYRTRWSDNDQYAHVNNSVYYLLFDSVVNAYLIAHCGLDPPTSPHIGLVVHSHCDYFAPVEFPALVHLCLRVNKLGRSSVTYEIGVFEADRDAPNAVGEFVHVFVDRNTRRPEPTGMPAALHAGLAKLLAPAAKL